MSSIKNISKTYDKFTLSIPELSLPESGITVLWGASGSGKTTLFRILLGLEECDGASWEWNGEDLLKNPAGERNLGVVFQSLELFPHMTARQNIEFAGNARGQDKTTTVKRLNELASAMEITDILDKKANILSGGQKQRVALARALVAPVKFLFLDEPFSALDQNLRQKSRELVKDLVQRYQVPTLLITHDKEDSEALGDHVVRLHDGKLV